MQVKEFKRIRMKFGMTQDDFAELLGLAGKKTVSSIETGFRNPSQLTGIILRVLDSLSERRAKELIELMQEQGKKQ